jgi:hypothetical protein
MNFRVPQTSGNFFSSWIIIASQGRLCSKELEILVSFLTLFVSHIPFLITFILLTVLSKRISAAFIILICSLFTSNIWIHKSTGKLHTKIAVFWVVLVCSLFNDAFFSISDYIASISTQSWFVCHLAAKQVKRGWKTWPLNFADEYLSCS